TSTKPPAAEPAPTTALDAVASSLETLRPFVVLQDGHPKCDAYTPAATALIADLAAKTPAATTARTSGSAAVVAAWQHEHDASLAKLINEVALPIRMDTGCEAMQKDAAWTKISAAIVAVGQRADPPPPIIKRRAFMTELLTAAANIKVKADCKSLEEVLASKSAGLETDLKSMSTVDSFIDDKVWEEEEEHRMKADPNGMRLIELCEVH
ncbi:MAG: hypothetical protein JWO36_2892, partial [Myxococcales bacterium]|nr:hypothetical protein [Myxococcales bacterium]